MAVREKIAVVGGGAAGQMAAIMAARRGLAVTLFEKNEKLGKKLYITGKGRCNVTNDCSREDFFENIIENPRFLYSAYTAFDQRAVMELIEQAGTPLKVERGQRVFPVSDKSSDVLAALERAGREAGVQVRLYTQIKSVLTENGEAVGLVTREGEQLFFDKVILATGGRQLSFHRVYRGGTAYGAGDRAYRYQTIPFSGAPGNGRKLALCPVRSDTEKRISYRRKGRKSPLPGIGRNAADPLWGLRPAGAHGLRLPGGESRRCQTVYRL